MNSNNIYDEVGYILASEYRSKVLQSIGDAIKKPSTIGNEIGLRTNHVSNVLADLKKNNFVVCLNEDAKKGRLYQNTDLGKKVLKFL